MTVYYYRYCELGASELSKPVTPLSGARYPPLGYLNLASSSDLLTPHNFLSVGFPPFKLSNKPFYPATTASPPNAPPLAEYGGYLAQLRLGQVASLVVDPGATPDATERHAVYQAGLEAAHELRQSALASATVARQNKAAAELWGWLQRYRPGVSPATCSDEDLAAYVMKGWLPNHHSRASADVPAGPSALKSHLSSLSGYFNRIDRGGPYNSSTSRGNPCESSIIEDLRTAYQREQVQAGYAEVSAVPMTEAKYRALAFYLWAQYSAAATAIERLVALRDHSCVLLLWQTAVRGHDLGKLGTGDFVNPDNTALPFQGFPLLPPWQWGSYLGPILCFCERGTKTHKLARAPPIFLMPDVAEPRLSIPRVLALYMALCSAADAPPGSAVADLLFRPLAPDGKRFKETPLSSSAMGARLRMHLVAAGLYGGETVHSFRRNSLQNAQAVGLPPSSLLDLGQLRTPAVLEHYLDSSRHLGRDVRARVE